MKKKFISVLLVASMVCIASIDAMEEEQMCGETRIGENSVCLWDVQGPREFCDRMEEELRPERHLENFTLLSPDGKSILQINPEGQLTIGGDKKQECVVMRDAFGKTIFDTKQMKETDPGSLDQEETRVLQVGSSVIWRSSNSSKITVTYDKIITLISEKENFEFPVLLSYWNISRLVSIAMSQNRIPENRGRVFLDGTAEEIKLLNNFLKFDAKGRKKVLGELSILENIKLLASLHEHGYTKKFGCNYFDYARGALENRVYGLLKKATSLDVSCWPTAMEWFKAIKWK